MTAEQTGRPHSDRIPVITAAEPSYDEQFRSRRKRYVIMMGLRVPFLIAAAATYHTPWLALTLIAISIPLPWCAVLIANDRPARKRVTAPRRPVNHERALAPGSHEIVDSYDASDEPATESGSPGERPR